MAVFSACEWQGPNSKPSLSDSKSHVHSIISWCLSSFQGLVIKCNIITTNSRFHYELRIQWHTKFEVTQGNPSKVCFLLPNTSL